jgi:PAS domain S-box-containing protein
MSKEIILDEHQYIVSRTDKRGIITSCNEYFQEVSGYSEEELVGANHNIIRHPDMPKAIFKFMWHMISKEKKNLTAVVKNMTKYGDYYWVITDFTITDVAGELQYKAKRTKPNRSAIKRIEPIYKNMLEIEKRTGGNMDKSLQYLLDVMKEAGYDDYNEFIKYLSRESLFEKVFLKKLF